MHITIFEEKDFTRWCQNDIENHKESIIRRACTMLLSTSNKRRDINTYSVGESILFDNLDNIKICYEVSDDCSKTYNTSLADRCLTISYEESKIKDACFESNVSYSNVEYFFNKLFNFITDAAIVEWKLLKGLSMPCIKVENSIMGDPAFFPVSYHVSDLILVIESLTGKRVKFTCDETDYAKVTKENIICYFSTERLESEYIISEQLLQIYLKVKGFFDVDKFYFTDMQKWKYDEETLNMAVHIVLQNKFISLLILEEYPIYKSSTIFSWLNFKESEDYMSAVCRYLCSYSKKHKLCSHCSGLDDIFNNEWNCPLYKDDSILDKYLTLEDLSTPEKHNILAEELINTFIIS